VPLVSGASELFSSDEIPIPCLPAPYSQKFQPPSHAAVALLVDSDDDVPILHFTRRSSSSSSLNCVEVTPVDVQLFKHVALFQASLCTLLPAFLQCFVSTVSTYKVLFGTAQACLTSTLVPLGRTVTLF
jgi:hypothetical protein